MKKKDLFVLIVVCVLLIGLIVAAIFFGTQRGKNSNKEYFVEFHESDISDNFYIDGRKLSDSGKSELADEISILIEQIEDELSTEKKESDISRINSAKAGEAVTVSADTYELLMIAKELYSITDGSFSPSLYNLSDLWGFTPNYQGRYGDSRKEPEANAIASALVVSDFNDIKLTTNNSVIKSNRNVKIDFGGLAKGYMCDTAASFIRQKYAGKRIDGTITVMSNSIVFGSKPSGEGYSASVSDPRAVVTGGVSAAIANDLSNVAISTSADTYRSYVYEDKIYSHIINPLTGKPSDNGIISITVLVPTTIRFPGTYADAFSTAGFCKQTLKEALAFYEMLADEYDVGAIIISSDYRYYVTGGYTFLNPDDFMEEAVSAYSRTDISDAPSIVIACDKELAYIKARSKE